MDGRLIRSSAVCRRNWGVHTILPGIQKCSRTTSGSVVLSGFPTALEPTLPRLSFGQTLVTLPSDRKAGQLLLSPDDIPPPAPVVVAIGVCRLRLARIYGSSFPSSLLKGAVWEGRTEFFLGGIRKSIVTGRQIRDDVRSAAHEVWKEACRRTQSLLADPAQAADVMEDSVVRVSRYLDRIGAPSSSPKNGLLLLAFSRALRRLAAKSRRLEPAGGAVELSSRAVDQVWSRQVDARLDLENIVRKLSERNSVVLALRAAGYTWEEVAQALGTSVATVRNSFWREVRDVKRKFQVDEDKRHRSDHRVSQENSNPAHPD